MKRAIAIIGLGILLLLVLSAVVSGERSKPEGKTPTEIEKQPAVGQPSPVIDESARPAEDANYPSGETTIGVVQPVMVTTAEPSAYEISWQSINAGGGDMQSTSYEISSSVGQSVIGFATSDNYQAGIGYWYGTAAPSGCDCAVWGDVNDDGNINPQDVTYMVQFVYYQNDMRVQPPNCPLEAGDMAGCNGQVNPQDVTYYVQYVYFQNDMFCPDPCD